MSLTATDVAMHLYDLYDYVRTDDKKKMRRYGKRFVKTFGTKAEQEEFLNNRKEWL